MEWLGVGIIVVGVMFGFGEAWAETRGPEAQVRWLRELVHQAYPSSDVEQSTFVSIPQRGVTVRSIRGGRVELKVELPKRLDRRDWAAEINAIDEINRSSPGPTRGRFASGRDWLTWTAKIKDADGLRHAVDVIVTRRSRLLAASTTETG